MPDAAPLDVSGRPFRLRDVDIDAFLHPKTIAVIGASEQSAKPNTAMTRKFDQWAKHHGATFYPVHPEYETVLASDEIVTGVRVPSSATATLPTCVALVKS